MARELANWLPGKLSIQRGTRSDYQSLSRFHYLSTNPAVWAGIWRVVYRDRDTGNLRVHCEPDTGILPVRGADRIVAVGVLTYPAPSCRARDRVLRLNGTRYDRRKIRWLNANLRTISRIIIHPQFRGIGLAGALVRSMCRASGVRYVEAIARMGRAVPFFERAGMTHHATSDQNAPPYYLWDRRQDVTRASCVHRSVTGPSPVSH